MTMTPPAAPALLQLEFASVRLARQYFGPFSVEVRAGERVAILGPSGAGKSTLLKMMSRELKPASGQVRFGGYALDSWDLGELSRRRAVLPQHSDVAFGLMSDLVIGLGRASWLDDPRLDEIVAAAAALAHASHLLGRRMDTMSGGEQARVQLARIFAQLWDAERGLVLVDEPLAALDPGLQFDLLESMERFAAERGHAIVAILHDINHALLGFERLLLLKSGRLCGDVAGDATALPALEALYGIALNAAPNADGDLCVVPARRAGRAALKRRGA